MHHHRGLHRQPEAHGAYLQDFPAGICVPRSGLQACAHDGGQPQREYPEQCAGHQGDSRPEREIRREEVCDAQHRQGREPHQCDGLLEAHLRDLCAEPRQGHQGGTGEGTHVLRDHTIRQCAGLQRLGDTALQTADRGGRTGHGDAPEHHTLLHAHTRGLQTGARGGHAGQGRRDFHLRHGQAGAHSRPGQEDDSAERGQGRED